MAEVRALRPLVDAEVADYDGVLVLRKDVKVLQSASFRQSSVHLLPYFDVYLLAHRFKEHFLQAKFYKRVYRNQGWISPVVLIDGQIAGVWNYKLSPEKIDIEIELFGRVARNVRAQINDRAEELAELFQRVPSVSFKN